MTRDTFPLANFVNSKSTKFEKMNKLVTLAVFDNAFDVKFNLLKSMLEEAGIVYITNNENTRTVKPVMFMTATNLSIDIKVYEENLEEAMELLKSIS